MPLAVLTVVAGCHSPAYSAFQEEQEKYASMSSDSSGALGTTDSGESESTGTLDSEGVGTAGSDTTGSAPSTATGVDDTTGSATTASTGDTGGGGSTTGPGVFCGDGVINQDFEECDVPSPDPEGPCTATCQRSRIIFALSLSLQGNMNGLQGADAYCKSQAVKARQADPSSALHGAGTFQALLSTSKETVFERHFQGAGPYRLVNGLTVSNSFKALFNEPLQNTINVDEFGHTRDDGVWTGTDIDGSPYPGIDFCGDWTSNEGSSNFGFSDVIEWCIDAGDEVFGNPVTPCYDEFAVYCVEEE